MNKLDSCSGRSRDILSYLPDSIRSHVVSFLPMKDAFRTKILSRTWRNICSSLSNLEFDRHNFKTLSDFRNFVDKTLILHDGSDVSKFSLFFLEVNNEFLPTDHIHAWITFAMQHNVQDLQLLVSKSSPIILERLPRCFFTCSTISSLCLTNCDNLEWPTTICFSMLKRFDLYYVTFYDENVTNKLFSSSACPMLDHLRILYCKFEGMHTLSISFPSLERLHLISRNSLNVNLFVPILRKFYYSCPSPPNISCNTLSSMFLADLYFSMPDSMEGEISFCNSIRKIMMGLPNVEKLTLPRDIIEVLAKDPELLSYLPASYSNLKDFSLDIMPSKSHIEVTACLLRICPSLRSLRIYISVGTSSDTNHRQNYWQLNEISIANSLKQLKRASIWGFTGSESEMYMVRRLLESASILEEMRICYEHELHNHPDKRQEIREKLSSFKRISSHAAIGFSYFGANSIDI